MFCAEPESPSFVENAMTSGRPFRRCALAAMVTAVSVMPWLSFAIVLPVHGAMTSASMGFDGPRGSASIMLSTGSLPVISRSRALKSAALPKRVSAFAAVSLIMGTSSYFSPSLPSWAKSFSYVQYEPQRAIPTLGLFTDPTLLKYVCDSAVNEPRGRYGRVFSRQPGR